MTQTPPSPSLSTKGQWNMIHHYLDALPLSDLHSTSTPPLWLSSLDRRLLLAALAKKRSELELLRAKAEHAPLISQFSIHLPSHDPLAAPKPPTFGVEGFPTTDLRSPASPGPRRNSYFSSSASSRRRSRANAGSPVKSEDSDDEDRAEAWRLASRDWERRVQWEAAWCWIERHLDFYADKFKACDRSPSGRKIVIWEELVRVWGECEEMAQRVRDCV